MQIIEDQDIGIACVTESWFNAKSGTFSQIIKRCGYELHHAYRKEKRGGGVAIVYRKQLMIKEGDASSEEFSSFEYASILMTVHSKMCLMVVCVYRKQEIPFSVFQDEFGGFIDKILNRGVVALVMGDFNVWVDVEDDSDAQKLTTLMTACGLTQMIHTSTHRAGHTLDHVYANQFELEVQPEVLPEMWNLVTDHFPIIMKVPSPGNQKNTRTITYRKLKDIDVERFRNDLIAGFGSVEFANLNFRSMYEQYDRVSRSVMDRHGPVQKRIVRSTEAAWMDVEYRKNRSIRRKLERMWRKNRTEENMINYINQKQVCTQMALTKQTHHYSKIIEDSSNTQKSLFKVANELLDKNQKKVLPAHDDPRKLANEFNNYFVDKVKKIRNSIPEIVNSPAFYHRPFKGKKLINFRPTTEDELKEIISKHRVKTCFEDPIPLQMFKAAIDIILPVLVIIVNKSLADGDMDGVNWSIVDPLIKKLGLDADIWKNFRPVNNLLFFSKLSERVVSIRMDEHMDINNLHEPSAFAYKAHHNTETMMLGVTDQILRGFDDNMATIVIFIDLSAAFDTIDIDKLLEILEDELGISGTALQWFRSFLTGRTQQVKISGEYSDSLEVPCGAPQGSVLGPKLFNANVRSQPLVFAKCMFSSSSFADDSNGRRTFALTFQFSILKYEIAKCMKQVIDWSFAHFMKINPDKTEIALFRPASLNNQVIINGVFIEEQCIRFSEEIKNVGVWLDQNLTMAAHINIVVSHCYKILRDVSRIKKYLQKCHLERLVHAIITHRLDYCNSLFVNVGRDNIYKLQKVQNAAARLILGKRRRDSATAALQELHWLNVEARITFKILLLVYKVIRGQCNMQLTYKSFNGRPDDYLLLETPNFKTNYGKRLFEYNGSRLWNALPVHIRSEDQIEKYKTAVKTMLFTGHERFKQIAFKYRT